MEFELERLVKHFTNISFRVQGIYHYVIEPGSSGRQRTTQYPGFIFPIGGKAQYHFNGTPYTANRGKVIHGGADMVLDKLVVGNTRWEYMSVFYDIKDSGSKDIFLPETHFEIITGQSPRLTGLLMRLHSTFSQPGAIPHFQTKVLFQCALEEVFISARNRTSDGAYMLFERASSYIHHHYMDELMVHELAEQNGVSKNRLFYVFSRYAGMGPGDYLVRYRLNRAKELLVTGDDAISEIAKSVGYDDALYFSRIFKKHFELPPSELRSKFRNNPYTR